MRFLNTVLGLAVPLAITMPLAAFAAEDPNWHCTNADFEISCDAGKCTRADAHTPMDIDVNRDEISWCAYSGCWTGPTGATVSSGPFVSFHGLSLSNPTDPSYVVDVAIIIDTRSNSATIMASGLFYNTGNLRAKITPSRQIRLYWETTPMTDTPNANSMT